MPQWLDDAIFYEIYPQSFYDSNADGVGDINGITAKLPYIKELGFNAVWINPCFDSPFLDAGYDVRNYKLVAPRYGTNEDLIRCFDAAHQIGIKIILDLVPGHTSYQHEWFKMSSLSQENEYTNRYIWTNSVWDAPLPYRFVSGMAERDGNSMVNFFSSQPALNYGFNEIKEPWQLPPTHPDCIATREAMKDVIRFWLDAGCDGFRVDMADSLVKNDEEKTETSKIWRNVREMLDEGYPEAALISEWSNPKRAIKSGFHCDFYLDHMGKGYHALMRYVDPQTKEHRSYFSKLGSGDAAAFTAQYTHDYENTKNDGYICFITGNHDTARLSKYLDPTELKIAYAFLLTMPGVPFLYYGDEIGMKFVDGLKSKEGGYPRTGTRTPMQWDNGANKGFSQADADRLYLPVDDSLDAPTVESQLADPDSLIHEVRRLTALRHANKSLHGNGPFEVVYAAQNAYPFIYRRGNLTIAVNPSGRTEEAQAAVQGKIIYSIGEEPVCSNDRITMKPQSFMVFLEE